LRSDTRPHRESGKEHRGFSEVLANAANDDVSFSEWSFDMEITGTGAMKMNQVAK
jgi:hypothetical protein